MSDPIVQTQTSDERLREQLQLDAFARDRARRQAELDRQSEVQAQRQAERAARMDAPVAVSLGFQPVDSVVFEGKIQMVRLGSGVLRITFEDQNVDHLELPEALWKSAKAQQAR